jgi:hypothetical protein
MKGFGIIGMAAIAGLIGYFCEPALRPILTPAAEVPAQPVAIEPAPKVIAPKPELPAKPAPETTPPAVEAPAPAAEPETPAEPTPDQSEESAPEQPAPAATGKVDLPPAKPLVPATPPDPTAENSPVIVAMQESFQNDGLKEFTEATPTRWQAGAEETIKGETYQTGLLDYLAQTPFGGKAMQVKALLRDGKVVKWVSLTGKELK